MVASIPQKEPETPVVTTLYPVAVFTSQPNCSLRCARFAEALLASHSASKPRSTAGSSSTGSPVWQVSAGGGGSGAVPPLDVPPLPPLLPPVPPVSGPPPPDSGHPKADAVSGVAPTFVMHSPAPPLPRHQSPSSQGSHCGRIPIAISVASSIIRGRRAGTCTGDRLSAAGAEGLSPHAARATQHNATYPRIRI